MGRTATLEKKKPCSFLPPNNLRKAAYPSHYINPQGFLARANGIPALELYRLAQKKKQKLVLCGHSLGGAVSPILILF